MFKCYEKDFFIQGSRLLTHSSFPGGGGGGGGNTTTGSIYAVSLHYVCKASTLKRLDKNGISLGSVLAE